MGREEDARGTEEMSCKFRVSVGPCGQNTIMVPEYQK